MRRRDVIALISGFIAAPLTVAAQQPGRLYRIGVLSPDDPVPGLLEGVREGLRSLGYVEGQHIAIELRNAGGQSAQLAPMAEELIRLRVDVILAVNTPAVQAAKNATTDIPIIMTRVADPVTTGLVASLSRPGGNVTGLSFIPDALSAKRLQLLKELLPGITRVAALWYAANPGAATIVREMEAASPQLGLELLRVPVQGTADLGAAFRAMMDGGTQAILVVDDAFITKCRADILGLAIQHRLPVSAMWKDFAEAGALVAYGPSSVMYYRAAHYIDKILKGATPADLPVEQPTDLDLIVNLRAAKALGIAIPPSLLALADEVIE
jgi:putative ABC transport system substrate-binding protein